MSRIALLKYWNTLLYNIHVYIDKFADIPVSKNAVSHDTIVAHKHPINNATNKQNVGYIQWKLTSAWSDLSLHSVCTQWTDKPNSFLQANSKDSDQTGWTPRLIKSVLGTKTFLFVYHVLFWWMYLIQCVKSSAITQLSHYCTYTLWNINVFSISVFLNILLISVLPMLICSALDKHWPVVVGQGKVSLWLWCWSGRSYTQLRPWGQTRSYRSALSLPPWEYTLLSYTLDKRLCTSCCRIWWQQSVGLHSHWNAEQPVWVWKRKENIFNIIDFIPVQSKTFACFIQLQNSTLWSFWK